MKEGHLALLITIILITLGTIVYSISISYTNFNFYRSEFVIQGNSITETLYYKPDKDYHTIFRTFNSNLTPETRTFPNSITIHSVECKKGEPYFNSEGVCYYRPDFNLEKKCGPFIQENEYGCTTGNIMGLLEDNDYWIKSKYILNPENIFEINNTKYIKFIAYSKNNHKKLDKNNFNVSGNALYKNEYLSNEDVLIYIPFDQKNISIIQQKDFKFDSKTSRNYLLLFLAILPGIFVLFTWLFFGSERIEEDVPDQLSQYPNKRKAWEVASFFNPPFAAIDKNFISTMLLTLLNKKIIDIKLIENNLYVKVDHNEIKKHDLDDTEIKFIEILDLIQKRAFKEYLSNGFFNLTSLSDSLTTSSMLRPEYKKLASMVNKKSKNFFEKTGFMVLNILFVPLIIFFLILKAMPLLVFSVMTLITINIISYYSTLLIRYKNEYFLEYKKWQSFKKWLSYSPSMKDTEIKGLVLWNEYLIYATALGVSKKILDQMKVNKLITKEQYILYSSIEKTSASFAFSTGRGTTGSGFGGASSGGIGGGGGGGR